MSTEMGASAPLARVSLPSDRWWLAAVGSVIIAVGFASIFSPDLVTGSQQDRLPVAAITDWLWGAAAVGYLAFVPRDRVSAVHGAAVALLWLSVAATSIAAPEFVTGSDPTRLPLAALIAPVVGTVVTGFLCLHAVQPGER